MSNDPKADLIYAILTLDSYNRGYGAGITGLSDDIDTKIGNFSVKSHTNNEQNPDTNPSFSAGFYAIAYKDGITVTGAKTP
jgi:hypothetical protein